MAQSGFADEHVEGLGGYLAVPYPASVLGQVVSCRGQCEHRQHEGSGPRKLPEEGAV